VSDEYESPEDYMGERQGSRERELVIALAAALRPPRNDNRMLGWLLGITGTLTGSFVIGGILLYGKVSAIEANQQSQQRQLDQLASTVAAIRSHDAAR
jgi:hypothetical protein